MGDKRTERHPVFFWQATLILLPVVILAVVGLLFLRQDKLLARREAEAQAQSLADDMLAKCWSVLFATNGSTVAGPHAIMVDAQGNLQFPPPLQPTPSPITLDLSQLNPEQQTLWIRMEAMEAGRADLASQIEAATKLVASNPPEPFLPIALYSLGLLEQKAGHRTEGKRAFERLLNEFPAALGEVGLPLKPLARLKLIELATEDTNSNSTSLKATLTDLCASLVFEPTPLSLPILQILENLGDRLGSTTEVARWRASWEHSEILREFYVAARPQLTRALPAFWLSPAEMSGQTSHDVASLQKWVALRPEFPPRIESDDSRQAAAPAILTPLAFAGEPDGMNLRTALNSQNFGGRPTNSPGTRDNSWVFCYEESELERRLGSCLSQTVLPGYV